MQLKQLLISAITLGLASTIICHWLMRNSSLKELSLKTPAWILGIIWAIMFFLMVIAQGSGEQFIYFQF